MQAMNEIERLSEKLHVPAVIRETAAVIYRKALDADLVRGRSITSIAAAALYAACRLTETPKTLKEIVDASLRERGEISRCYRMIIRMLRIKMPVPDPIDYVSKIAEKAGVSNDTQGVAVNIILEAKRRRIIAGKDPVGVAAAALYIASRQNNERITQRGIAEAAKVTEVTIRNRKEELVKTLNLKIDKTSR
jgi:transcription initiation factor TFIIB